ncbi:Uncharacterized protein Rs2_13189 [Raphanus sativus]|nr:Uncharacterized protein Rs2_13189 [Raphanus sativus]
MNLFATLERVGGDLFQGSGSVGVAFETPMMAKEKKNVGGGYSGNGEYVSSVGSKTNFINLEDVELVEEVERFEARAKSASKSTGAADLSGCSEGLESDLSGYSGPEEVDDRDVRPKGYDYHFWEPLIAGDLGGTDALETVFNGKDEAGSVKMEDGRRGNSSNTGGSSRGLQGDGASCGWDGEDVMGGVHLDDLSWMGQTRLGGCVKRGQNSGGIRSTETWKETYAGVISPIGDPRDEDIPEDVRKKVLMPPVTKRPAGRRKTKRYLSTGEIPGPNKKEKQNRCGRCRGIGHNRTNCTVPLD